MSEKLPLEGKSYEEIQQLPLDTVINPTYEDEYHVTLAEALSLCLVMTKQPIPEVLVEHFKDSKRINARELADQAELWNGHFAFAGMIDAIHEVAASQIVSTVRKTSPRVYSEVKQIQILAAGQAISYAYARSI